ncbi:hypothetical protein, partial [Vibrio anguillarum]|uniref:hypothetical protein n=1 Tax=Vibrio anguillarum TaxID=55601 RepID=UPI001BE477D1
MEPRTTPLRILQLKVRDAAAISMPPFVPYELTVTSAARTHIQSMPHILRPRGVCLVWGNDR